MTLLVFLLIGLAAAPLCGGRLSYFGQMRVRGIWLPLLSYGWKAAAPLLLLRAGMANSPCELLVCVVHYGLLLAFAGLNRQLWSALFGLGTGLNFLVIAANGGAMPVNASALAADSEQAARLATGEIFSYAPITASTRLPWLGDVLAFRPFGHLLGFASVGDLILGTGAALLVICLFRPARAVSGS